MTVSARKQLTPEEKDRIIRAVAFGFGIRPCQHEGAPCFHVTHSRPDKYNVVWDGIHHPHVTAAYLAMAAYATGRQFIPAARSIEQRGTELAALARARIAAKARPGLAHSPAPSSQAHRTR